MQKRVSSAGDEPSQAEPFDRPNIDQAGLHVHGKQSDANTSTSKNEP